MNAVEKKKAPFPWHGRRLQTTSNFLGKRCSSTINAILQIQMNKQKKQKNQKQNLNAIEIKLLCLYGSASSTIFLLLFKNTSKYLLI